VQFKQRADNYQGTHRLKNNLRQGLGTDAHYVSYCREERNFAAVLYHMLLDEGRLTSFLDLIGTSAVDIQNVRIYFEYAHLRDLWASVAKDATSRNARCREAIITMLNTPDVALPEACKEFNEFFIGKGSNAASADYIQMPSRWSDSQFFNWHEKGGVDFAKRACTLKWAFNAKPDLVLHLGGDKVVCIEAKLESSIGGYRVKSSDPLGCFSMSQIKLQEFILQQVLGYATDFVIVCKEKNTKRDVHDGPWRRYTWLEVFGRLLDDHPPRVGESRMVRDFHDRIQQLA
jgi:hypothetical protein